jgi:Clostripain family
MGADEAGKFFTNAKIEAELTAIQAAVARHPSARIRVLADTRNAKGIRGFVEGGEFKQEKLEVEPQLRSPVTLKDFLSSGLREHPTDHFLVILWGHGYGPAGLRYEGAAARSFLRPNDMGLALRKAFGLHPADIVAFMSCHMSTIELAYEFQLRLEFEIPPIKIKAADFLVASQGLVNPPAAFPYDALFEALANNPEPRTAGRRLVDMLGTSFGPPFALLDVSKSTAVRDALASLAGVLSKPQFDPFRVRHDGSTPLQQALHEAIGAAIPDDRPPGHPEVRQETAIVDLMRLGRNLAAIGNGAARNPGEEVNLAIVRDAAGRLVDAVERQLVVHTGPRGAGARQFNGVSVYCPPHHAEAINTSTVENAVQMSQYRKLGLSQPHLDTPWANVVGLAHQ